MKAAEGGQSVSRGATRGAAPAVSGMQLEASIASVIGYQATFISLRGNEPPVSISAIASGGAVLTRKRSNLWCDFVCVLEMVDGCGLFCPVAGDWSM